MLSADAAPWARRQPHRGGMADLLVVISAALALASLANRSELARPRGRPIHVAQNHQAVIAGAGPPPRLRLPGPVDQPSDCLVKRGACGPLHHRVLPAGRAPGAPMLAIVAAKLVLLCCGRRGLFAFHPARSDTLVLMRAGWFGLLAC
jgi:hypothetical protein